MDINDNLSNIKFRFEMTIKKRILIKIKIYKIRINEEEKPIKFINLKWEVKIKNKRAITGLINFEKWKL